MSEILDLDADEKLVIKRNGQEVELRFPSVYEEFGLEKAIKRVDKDNIEEMYNVQKRYIVKLGMPEELLEGLSTRKFLALVEALQGKKK